MKQKILSTLITLFLVTILISACESPSAQNHNAQEDTVTEEANDSDRSSNDNSEEHDTDHSHEKTNENNDDGHNDDEASQETSNHNIDTSDDIESEEALTGYSSEEIEYARVWAQLGENQDVDHLYAEHISAGEPLNPDDKTSLDYPEDVVQLSGSRLIDGVVTYSSNGEGTINVYHVPKRWDGMNPAGEEMYKKIIEDTTHESIDPRQGEAIESLIQKLSIE